jgi:hypothetical protein
MRTGWILVAVIAAAAAFAVARPAKQQPVRLEAEPVSAADLADPPEPGSLQPEPTTDAALSGEVLEALAAGNYTCLRLRTASGEVWAAVPRAKIALHSNVSITGASEMKDFTSPTLKRTFASIYFGTLAGPGDEHPKSAGLAPVDPATPLPPGHPDVSSTGTSCAPEADQLPPGHPAVGGARAGAQLPAGHPRIDPASAATDSL